MLTGDNKWNSRRATTTTPHTSGLHTGENTHTGIIENVNRGEPRRGGM